MVIIPNTLWLLFIIVLLLIFGRLILSITVYRMMGKKLSRLERSEKWISILVNISILIGFVISIIIGFVFTWSHFGAEDDKLNLEIESLKTELHPEEYVCGESYIYYYPNQSGLERSEWLGVYLQNNLSLKDVDYLINVFPENAKNNVTIEMTYNNINFNRKNVFSGNYSLISWGDIPKRLPIVNRPVVGYNLSWNTSLWNHGIITGDEISIQVSVNQNQTIIDISEPKELNYTTYERLIGQSSKTIMPDCVFLST